MKIWNALQSMRGWKYMPSIGQAGFSAKLHLNSTPRERNILFGMKYLSGDAIWVEYGPCLNEDHVSLSLKVVSSQIDYWYSLTSVKNRRPFTVTAKLMDHRRIVCSVDAFEGVESIITTHEKFCKTLVSFDITSTLKTDEIKVKRLR